jgi:hypothetical protein
VNLLAAPLLALALAGAVVGACKDEEQTAAGRTPRLTHTAAPTLDKVSGQIDIVIEARTTITGDRGTFTMTGVINDSGTVITRRSQEPDAVVKEREFRGNLGTIFVHMEGDIRPDGSAGDFTWRITGATEEYQGLTGGGTGVDTFQGSARLRGEFSGNVAN